MTAADLLRYCADTMDGLEPAPLDGDSLLNIAEDHEQPDILSSFANYLWCSLFCGAAVPEAKIVEFYSEYLDQEGEESKRLREIDDEIFDLECELEDLKEERRNLLKNARAVA